MCVCVCGVGGGGEREREREREKERERERERERSACLTRFAIVLEKPCCICVFGFPIELDIGVTAQVQTAETARRALSVMLPAVLVVSFCVLILIF